MGLLAQELLLYSNIPRLLQLAQMRGEIAPCQPGLALQEEEVHTFNDKEIRDNHQPGRFVDYSVDLRN